MLNWYVHNIVTKLNLIHKINKSTKMIITKVVDITVLTVTSSE